MGTFLNKFVTILLMVCICCGSGRYNPRRYEVKAAIDNTYSYEIKFEGQWIRIGTAFAYKYSPLKPAKIITAKHVAEVQDFVDAVRICQAQHETLCEVVKSYASSEAYDIAELKISSTRRQGLFKQHIVSVGDKVNVSGFPLGGELFLTEGIVSSPWPLAIDAECLPGHSGSPVVSSQGKVIGVVSAVRVENFGLIENWCIVIPIDKVDSING